MCLYILLYVEKLLIQRETFFIINHLTIDQIIDDAVQFQCVGESITQEISSLKIYHHKVWRFSTAWLQQRGGRREVFLSRATIFSLTKILLLQLLTVWSNIELLQLDKHRYVVYLFTGLLLWQHLLLHSLISFI